jgi:hypothetical protein
MCSQIGNRCFSADACYWIVQLTVMVAEVPIVLVEFEMMVALRVPLNEFPHEALQCGTPVWSTPMQPTGAVEDSVRQRSIVRSKGSPFKVAWMGVAPVAMPVPESTVMSKEFGVSARVWVVVVSFPHAVRNRQAHKQAIIKNRLIRIRNTLSLQPQDHGNQLDCITPAAWKRCDRQIIL